ncbi:MAG: 4Fe-4S dicluster domain-containing protein [Propionicimonas sp.]|uniref:4Fe-4S dicluster domain-containing protein n=1 Tax=Propionicimonas sp. TaxID=1955623 RepID=UPI003D096B4E
MAPLRLVIDGHTIDAEPGTSLLQAWVAAGLPLTGNVGCMGQAVCGACRVLVRRTGERLATTGLACETLVEDGMQVAFVNLSRGSRPHSYDLHDLGDSWDAIAQVDDLFPEAKRCRHCSGCDSACPKGIQVEKMVNLAAVGQTYAAAELFDDCVQCNLCVAACPEHIDPAHLGQFVRRMTASMTLRPSDLIMRLHEIEAGSQAIDLDAPGAHPSEPDAGEA